MKTFCRTICLIVAFQFVSIPIRVSGGTVIQQPRFGYTLTLPDGWEQMPIKIIEEQMKVVTAATDGQVAQHYDDGYQQSAGGQWFQYPYILVQANEKGRVTEAQLGQMKSFRSALQKGADQTEEKLSSVISDMSLGETFYDTTNKCILIRFSMNVADIGEVKALTCGFLTQKGLLLFHCYTRASEFDAQLPIFQSMLKTVALSEELRYKSRLGDGISLALRRIGGSTLIGGIVGGLIGILFLLKKKAQSKKSQSIEPLPLP